MKYSITRKHNNSRMCAVCGIDNHFGVNARFYETRTGEIIGVFSAKDQHQGFPLRMHGGIISSVLDEAMGRTLNIDHPDEWSVTVDLRVRFKKPVPLNTEIKVVAKLDKENRKIFEARGEVFLPDGSVAAEGWGKFFRGKPEDIDYAEAKGEEWIKLEEEGDPEEIEI